MSAKQKSLHMASSVLRGRLASLQEEYERVKGQQDKDVNAADRAAMAELRLAAELVECLALGPVHGDPATVARQRWGRGGHAKYKAPV
ncbi:hypothetical protein [Salipiger mucosus]|uniref:hypothetical protein n=1 Tax=Salipiger mucosus TaxID=263378 RepID=UPI0012ECAE42|nr:hypothetical protein [Salipiger mucosus]